MFYPTLWRCRTIHVVQFFLRFLPNHIILLEYLTIINIFPSFSKNFPNLRWFWEAVRSHFANICPQLLSRYSQKVLNYRVLVKNVFPLWKWHVCRSLFNEGLLSVSFLEDRLIGRLWNLSSDLSSCFFELFFLNFGRQRWIGE